MILGFMNVFLIFLYTPIFNSYGLVTAPTVYFNCQGENKTSLPDMKKRNSLYTFKGEESWEPITEFFNKKCKRCGFYEKNVVMSDDIFDEWEFCPSHFKAPDGEYVRLKDKEVNATFYCPECVPHGRGKGLPKSSILLVYAASFTTS
ncbi:hypothetical protein MKW94_000416 [Papaver nudicaule]|uniref:DUF7953 domain-containing protein n=1 Tax=Papaver nudicaule TaxID=74823 RepID=A0AA41VYL3_PAPNU|nr:hypothetical protein [Papaver nudicaule]